MRGPRDANCLCLARVSAARRRVSAPLLPSWHHSGARQHSHDKVNLDILPHLEDTTSVETAGDHLDCRASRNGRVAAALPTHNTA